MDGMPEYWWSARAAALQLAPELVLPEQAPAGFTSLRPLIHKGWEMVLMAAELGPKQVRVNCVVPGAVATEINVRAGLVTEDGVAERYARLAGDHALKRIGTAEEVAEGIEYLVRAEWVTGVALDVDGGLGLGVSNF